jgi:AraC-like DNA-binding protein
VRHVPDAFKPVVEYVNQNFTQPMTTAQLSQKFGYNESYFCRQFRKVTGLNAIRYIQILRLEYAQKLLRGSDKTLAAIALESGFSDIYHFTHCFSKHFKISPDAYRKACRKG